MIQSIPWRYRCHRVCHLQMSLGSGIGQRAGAEPRRSAALDRRPMHRARNRTCCLSSRVSRSARRQAQPLWKDGRPIDARRRRYPDVRVLSSLSGRSGLELRLVHTAGFARYAQGAGFRLCPRARVEAKKIIQTRWHRARGEVELRLDESDRSACVLAQDRPRKEGSGFVERPRHPPKAKGHLGLPTKCPSVQNSRDSRDGQTFIAWRGAMLSWHTA
jgi:hypothetical protein